MAFLRSELIGLPVGSLEDRAKVGTVGDIVINPDDGNILGLIIMLSVISFKKLSVSWQDVCEVDKEAVVINSKDNILPVEEIVRINKLAHEGFSLIGLRVKTTQGDEIGSVYDFAIDTDKSTLARIFTNQLLKPRRIISKSNIVRIENDYIVVKSSAIKDRATVETPMEATAQ